MNNNYITVTQLTRYIKYKIDNDQNLIIEGYQLLDVGL